ncbi:carbonic anhydrase [Eurytemora carolleeae]|uniref:carbonic anhydrase n=1 Tax=Eurytemora carolleeae TaxID=1294199 RepID=UPI000C78B9CA|nr:carbonic anhydrase [Eurytemora carolleeae]|eukprot:XP_023342334.1 carbonic anhydrase-like [Eurytemora affinis]
MKRQRRNKLKYTISNDHHRIFFNLSLYLLSSFGKTPYKKTGKKTVLSQGSSWGYSADNGPDKWAEKYPLCGASSQSPLDLDVSTAPASNVTGALEFIGYETPLPATVSQNSHTFTLKPIEAKTAKLCLKEGSEKLLFCPGDSLPTIKGGSLPVGEIFEFAQFHLHWGKDDTKGSEHRLVGAMLPAEIHLVHWNKKYGDFGTAAAQSDGLAVVGFFYQVAASSNAKYTPILDGLKKLPGTENNFEVDIGSITLNDLIPAGATDHLHYKGSLTTPPCLESVFWNVFTDKIDLSDADLAVIRGVTDETGKSLSDNYRPPQPLNGRTVYSFKKA